MAGVTKLIIDDEEFLVASLIDRCPRVMMLRELYQNALEAAAMASGAKQVKIGTETIDGVKKLRIWNTGPGMDPIALHAMCDLSASIGKLKGLDQNFGIGAKVASLPSNHLGVRFRSCAEGRVYEIVLGRRNGVYGRLQRAATQPQGGGGSARLVEVIDVSSEIVAAGGTLDEDWTEVVLLGMLPEQDTSRDPYSGSPVMAEYWVPDVLSLRYFSTPADVVTLVEPDLQWFNDTREFKPLMQRSLEAFARYDVVETREKIRIHFFHDPAHAARPWENQSSDGSIHTSTTLVGVAWRNELYDVQRGSSWFYAAPTYGITFGARHLTVIIELPDDYHVVPEMYRQFLQYRHGSQGHVRASDFAALVKTHRPHWVREVTRSGLSTQFVDNQEGLIAELQQLVERTQFARPELVAEPDTEIGGNGFVSGVHDACGIEPVFLRDAVDVRDRWLEGRAAVYYPETAQVFINMRYDSRSAFIDRLKVELVIAGDDPELEQTINEVADLYLARRILRALVHGLSKAKNTTNWDAEHIRRATSPEALSTAADDLDDHVQPALSAIRRKHPPKF